MDWRLVPLYGHTVIAILFVQLGPISINLTSSESRAPKLSLGTRLEEIQNRDQKSSTLAVTCELWEGEMYDESV